MDKQSVTKGFAVLSAANMIVRIMSLVYLPILLSIIHEEGYGVYMAAYQIYAFIYIIANAGMPVAISKSISELISVGNYKDAVRSFKIARFFLIISGVVLSTATFVFARNIASLVHFEKAHLAILALSPTLLFTTIQSSYRGYFQGRSNMTPTAVSQVLEQVINVVFTLVFAAVFIPYGIVAACAGGTVGTSLGALVSMIFLLTVYRKNHKFVIAPEHKTVSVKRYTYKQLVRKILSYSIPITVSAGATYAGNIIDLWNTKDRLLAGGFSDAMASQMYGYIGKYQQIMNAPTAIVVALAVAMLPAISSSVAIKDRLQVQSKISYAFRWCLVFIMPSAVGLAVLSGPLFTLMYFGKGSFLLLYGSVVLILMSVVQIQASILNGAGKIYLVTIHQLIGIAVKITLNYILIGIPGINVTGAIVGSAVGFGIPLVLNQMAIKKHIKVNASLVAHGTKPLIAAAVMGASVFLGYQGVYRALHLFMGVYISNAAALLTAVVIGVMVYLYVMIFVKGITSTDIEAMPQRMKRLIPQFVLQHVR